VRDELIVEQSNAFSSAREMRRTRGGTEERTGATSATQVKCTCVRQRRRHQAAGEKPKAVSSAATRAHVNRGNKASVARARSTSSQVSRALLNDRSFHSHLRVRRMHFKLRGSSAIWCCRPSIVPRRMHAARSKQWGVLPKADAVARRSGSWSARMSTIDQRPAPRSEWRTKKHSAHRHQVKCCGWELTFGRPFAWAMSPEGQAATEIKGRGRRGPKRATNGPQGAIDL